MSTKHIKPIDIDEVSGPGLYAVTPFDNYDSHNKIIVKIGIAKDLRSREEGYHTYFIKGLYPFRYLFGFATYDRNLLLKMERHMFKLMSENGAVRLRRNIDYFGKDSETEWFYTDEKTITKVFKDTQANFWNNDEPTKIQPYDMRASKIKDEEEKQLNSGKTRTYVGHIIYKIPIKK
jgi:hypothetical protein